MQSNYEISYIRGPCCWKKSRGGHIAGSGFSSKDVDISDNEVYPSLVYYTNKSKNPPDLYPFGGSNTLIAHDSL